jgi:hypothetical protein
VAAVLKGSADAAAVHLRRFELEKHNGLVGIDTFSSTPRIVVARQGLEAHVAEAFRAALIHVRTTDRRPGDPDDNTGWEETLDRAVPIDDSYLRPLLDAMRKAARFDGKPEQFPED